ASRVDLSQRERSKIALLRRDVRQRKSGDALVIVRQRAQLVLGDVFVEIGERPVAHQLLDLNVDEVGRVLAVGAHHLGGRRRARPWDLSAAGGPCGFASGHSASPRASIAPGAPPFEPRGYIGWAASPASVTRPNVQRSIGSLSTIGYSRIWSALRISAATSSQAKRKSR